MATIIIYGSTYGTAKNYAKELSSVMGAKAVSYKDVKDISSYKRVIYIGGMYAGTIKGLKETAKRFPAGSRISVVSVGLRDPEDKGCMELIKSAVKEQMPEALMKNTDVFALRGKLCYESLSLQHKVMMKVLYTMLKNKPEEEKSDTDRLIIDTYGGDVDLVNMGDLKVLAEKLMEVNS